MSGLRRRWQMKPPLGCQPSGGSAPDKICALLNEAGGLTVQNLAPPQQLGSIINYGSWNYASGGQVLAHTSSANYASFGTDTSLGLGLSAITIVVGYRKRDTTVRQNGAIGLTTNSATNRIGISLPWPISSGTVFWDFGNINTNGRLSYIWTADAIPHVWAFTAGVRGMEMWQDSILVSSSGTSSSYASTGDTFTIGHANFADAGGSDLADYSFLYVWGYQISPSLIQQVSLDPYCFMNPPGPRRMWSIPSATFISAWAGQSTHVVGGHVS